MTTKSDGLIKVRNELFETYRQELGIPDTILNRVDEILDIAVEADQTRSRCYKTIIATVALIACRENNIPRVADDFANATIKNGNPLTRNEVHAEFRRLKRELDIATPQIDAEAHLNYYADELDVTEETRDTAHEFLTTARENGMANGPAPTSLAAGALDAARRLTNDDVVQTDIAGISHVSKNQFREYCQELMETPAA